MKPIPGPSRRRLVLLERLLSGRDEKTVTSQWIAEQSGWSAAVVRRDISLLGVRCGASNGYRVAELREALGTLVCSHGTEQKCCLVGLGHLGQMLLDATELDGSPFTLVAGFDSNVNRTEVLRSRFPLYPTTRLEQVIQAECIRYAILTAQGGEAQELAWRLAGCGVRGIVNYTPCMLTVPQGVTVENVGLLTALETLVAGA